MKIKIGNFDATTRTVPVTFTDQGVTHDRRVNAVLDDRGDYNRAATKKRVDEVALGVAHKMSVGAITSPPSVNSGWVQL